MSSYKIILKTTGLYAGLRVLSILVNVIISKLIAIFVGVSGIGLYGIFTSAQSLISSIADLGISKSSIRDISIAEGEFDKQKVEDTISLVSKLVYITGFLGCLFTIIFSYQISKFSFGNHSYWISFVLLGIAIFFTILKNGQSAILQGLRKYKLITNSTIYSSIISLIFSIPIIYFFKEKSIIYVILVSAIISAIITKFYLTKIDYKIKESNIKLNLDNTVGIVKLGLSMMIVSLLVSLSGYIIRSYISHFGYISDLGYFQAGFQIISGYFGIIFTSMSTDYFPRISAIQNNNQLLANEVNQQATITLLLICPLIVVLPFIMPLVIKILYTSEFTPTIDYVNIALFGIIFQAGSQTMGMIILAKNNAKVFTISVLLFQSVFLLLNILGYKYYGILGLGITFSINMFIHIIGIQILNYVLYKISFNKSFLFTFIIVFSFAILSYLSQKYLDGYWIYIAGIILFVLSGSFVGNKLKKMLKINSFVQLIKNKIGGKN